jgi:hypothetical protein
MDVVIVLLCLFELGLIIILILLWDRNSWLKSEIKYEKERSKDLERLSDKAISLALKYEQNREELRKFILNDYRE